VVELQRFIFISKTIRIYKIILVAKYSMNWFKMSQSKQPEQSEQSEQSEKTYVVKNGDTLSSISKKLLNDINRWREIQNLNNIENPDVIKPGQTLKIPSSTMVDKPKAVPQAPAVPQSALLDALKEEISKTEGNYGSYNKGTAGDTPVAAIDITKLTIGQIMNLQENRSLFAVGKYQMIPVTLKEAVNNKKIGLTVNDVFSPQNQEKLFMYLLYKRPSLMSYIEGRSDNIDAAVNDLAKEFASLPTTSGKGFYDEDKAGNKASGGISRVEKIKEILKNLRSSLSGSSSTVTQDAVQSK
jgi:LysM repeat protein